MSRKVRDPELKYCPRCGDEYRPEILTCANCRVELQLGRDILAAGNAREHRDGTVAEIEADENMIGIRRGPILQIKALRSHLLGLGLPSLLTREDSGSCGCRGPEVTLQVREKDLREVMAALAEEYWQSTGLEDHETRFCGAVHDDQAEETLCPACGFRFSTQETTCPDCGLCFG